MVESGCAESHHREEEKFSEMETTPIGGKKIPFVSDKKKAIRAVVEAMKKKTLKKMEEIRNQRNVVFRKIRMVKKKEKDLVGSNCVRDKNGKIVFAEDGHKSVEEAHGGHHE